MFTLKYGNSVNKVHSTVMELNIDTIHVSNLKTVHNQAKLIKNVN